MDSLPATLNPHKVIPALLGTSSWGDWARGCSLALGTGSKSCSSVLQAKLEVCGCFYWLQAFALQPLLNLGYVIFLFSISNHRHNSKAGKN